MSKIDIESEIVDLNAEILDLEQRMSEDGLGQDEFAFLGQELASRYDALDRCNAMLQESEEPENTSVQDFKDFKEQKKQEKSDSKKDAKNSHFMSK